MLGAGIDGYVVDLRNPPAWLDSSSESSGISDDAFDEAEDRAAFEPRPEEPQPQEAEPQPQDADDDDGWGRPGPAFGDLPLRWDYDGGENPEDAEAVVANEPQPQDADDPQDEGWGRPRPPFGAGEEGLGRPRVPEA